MKCQRQTFNGQVAASRKADAWPGSAPCVLRAGHDGPHDSGALSPAELATPIVGTRYEDGEGPEDS
jgi:hypothetical protein